MRDTVFFKQAELLLRTLPLIHKVEVFALSKRSTKMIRLRSCAFGATSYLIDPDFPLEAYL